MADYIVPCGKIIVKCGACKTLYVPDREKDEHWISGRFYAFERCPVCGSNTNCFRNTIPLWKYNLIKYFRKLKNGE